MARFNTNVHAKSHERVKLSGFRGVDTSSASVDVETFRATEMRNMISRNGLNHKRHGWEQQLLNNGDSTHPNNFGGAVRGIYGFKFVGDEQTRIIVYANRKFWEKKGDDNGFKNIITPDNVILEDRACQFYLVGDILYIIGMGDFLAYNGYTFSRVSESAYVPTTVINIVSKEYAAENTAAISRERLDEINLLTPYVKNELIGNLESETFELDHAFTEVSAEVYDKATGVLAETLTGTGFNVEAIPASGATSSCYIAVEDYNGKNAVKINATYESVKDKGFSLLTLTDKNEKAINVYLVTYNDTAKIVVDNTPIAQGYEEKQGCLYVILTNEWAFKVNKLGYLNLGISGVVANYSDAYITFYKVLGDWLKDASETTWATIDYGNQTVKFTKDISKNNIVLTLKTNTDYSKRITDCSISTMFGVNGHSDRLFVAGNKNRYNDWEASHVVQWSQIDDFTYFPETNYTKLGTQATAINGMQRLNDDSLCLFKEASTTEPTLYVMYGEYTTDENDNTKNIFRTYAGNVAEGLIAPNSTGNLAGDILMLSSNGVYGIEMDANVVSTSKYTKERGLPIKRLLKEFTREQLKSACSIVRDDRYLLCVEDKCFVAESRYRYKPKGSPRDTFSYEWYVWDNIPALCFAEIDTELYFGTKDGRLCKFTNGFIDVKINDFGSTTVSESVNEGTITVDGELKKGDIVIISDELYGMVATGTATESHVLQFDETDFYCTNTNGERLPKFIVGKKIRCFYKSNTHIERNAEIDDVDVVKLTIKVKGQSLTGGANIDENAEYYVCYPLQNEELVIDDPDASTEEEGKQAEVKIYDVPITQFFISSTPEAWSGRNVIKNNVVAEWFSAIMDFGTPDYSKTLLGFTVAPERIEGDKMEFGYITRELDRNHELIQSKGLSLDEFNLFNVSFNNINTSFTKKVKVRNFNYLMWFIKSDSPTDTAINNITIDYKINRKNKGEN
jgi:hypothetical protein